VYGFKYWSDPGAFSNGALGVVNAFVLASFSMQGTEIVGITAGECENPVKVTHIYVILHHKIFNLSL
jgi:lysine-specific permease